MMFLIYDNNSWIFVFVLSIAVLLDHMDHTHRIHGAGIYANMTGVYYIDGIHGAPYIAAPWIRHGI